MATTYWRDSEGRIIVDENGKFIKCDHCPCDSYSILVLKISENPVPLLSCPSDTEALQEYSTETTVKLLKKDYPYDCGSDEVTVGEAFQSDSTLPEHNKACVSFNLLTLGQVGGDASACALVAYIKNDGRVAICGSTNKKFYEQITVHVKETGYPYLDYGQLPDATESVMASNPYLCDCGPKETGNLSVIIVKYNEVQCSSANTGFRVQENYSDIFEPVSGMAFSCGLYEQLALYPPVGVDSVKVEISRSISGGWDEEDWELIKTVDVPKGGLDVLNTVDCDGLDDGDLQIKAVVEPEFVRQREQRFSVSSSTETLVVEAPNDKTWLELVSLTSSRSVPTNDNYKYAVTGNEDTDPVTLAVGDSATANNVKLLEDGGVYRKPGECS